MDKQAEKTIDEKLKEAREKREAIEKARLDREEAARKEDALEAELLEIENLEALEKLEKEYGAERVARIDIPDGRMVVVRAPKGIEFKRYLDSNGKGMEDERTFSGKLIVYPSTQVYHDDILDKYPGVFAAVMKAVKVLSGTEGKAQGKK